MIFEVFRREKRGAAFEHAGSVEAPTSEFAETWAREQYGRRGESEALWLVPRDEDPMYIWRIKSQGNEEARQQFLDGYVPQIWELGLTVPDPKLRKRDDGVWEYTEPDWDELKHVVTGHGPRTADRLAFRERFIAQEQWVRDVVLAA